MYRIWQTCAGRRGGDLIDFFIQNNHSKKEQNYVGICTYLKKTVLFSGYQETGLRKGKNNIKNRYFY